MNLLAKRGDTFPSVFNHAFDDFFRDDYSFPSFVGSTIPAVNVSEENDKFSIEVAAPGMEKKDFHLNIENNNVLNISCESKHEEEKKDKNYTRKEFNFTSFKRLFTLPESVNAEKVDAQYKDGILRITLLKKPALQKQIQKEIKIA